MLTLMHQAARRRQGAAAAWAAAASTSRPLVVAAGTGAPSDGAPVSSTSQRRHASSDAVTRSTHPPSGGDTYDVAILGGGMVGLALAGEIGGCDERDSQLAFALSFFPTS